MRYFHGKVAQILNVIMEKKKPFLFLAVGLMFAGLLTNVAILSAVTGSLPSSFLLNDGRFALQANLDDPLDQYLDEVFPYYNYPLAVIMFPRHFLISDEFGFKQDTLLAQPLFLNIHYFADFAPFALLISAYMVLTRYHLSIVKAARTGRVGMRGRSAAAGVGALAAPGVSSGASTALTAIAAGVCCGGFAAESSIYVLGFAISAAGFVLLSRVFMLAMAGFLLFGILRTARKINTCRVLPRIEEKRGQRMELVDR